ncbi:MBL fold metallo-hydrolase [Limibacter armeniacum]|uniref:MBL fold metallo-hydrolase n=1 Tax=Limibacter armeniacum TaxID=466084 RepID=UPI002FE5A0E1
MLKKLITAVLLLTAAVVLFVNCAPQFGGKATGISLDKMKNSRNYKDGKFVNLVETSMDMGVGSMLETMKEYFQKVNGTPSQPLPVKFGEGDQSAVDSLTYLTWFGHSAFLLEMEGQRILLDPMLGKAASPVPFMINRFPYEEKIDIDAIEDIDAVIISHDHYDHLDHSSIVKLDKVVNHFYVPLGVGAHLQRWGVKADKITELDWWQDTTLEHIKLVCTPSRHFSGRGLTDRNATLWSSWVIQGSHTNLYFSGDSGYAGHFKQIGEKFGPFDFTLMECGQYNEKWAQIHMMPEETLQAHLDVKGKKMMPIHWGAFELAMHTWTDPVERLLTAADKHNVEVVSPFIGERFSLNGMEPQERWWKHVLNRQVASK